MINKCVFCGNEFEAQKSTKKYCSKNCENKMKYIRQKERKEAEKQGINYNEKECLICGKKFIPKNKNANQRTCCYDCMPEGHQLMRGEFLAKIKQQRGGTCERCGYNKCIKALEFHHLNPSQKDFTISNDHFKLKDAIEESKKCILICANCHRELHDNLWNVEELILKEKEEVGLDLDE